MLSVAAAFSLALALVANAAPASIEERSPTMPFSPTEVTVHPSDESKCLTASSLSDGYTVKLAPCDGSDMQKWSVAPGVTYLRLAGTDLCLTDGLNPYKGWFPTQGMTPPVMRPCPRALPDPAAPGDGYTWSYDQSRRFVYVGSEAHVGFDLCFDNKDGASTDVQIWECFCKNQNQVWTTTPQIWWP